VKRSPGNREIARLLTLAQASEKSGVPAKTLWAMATKGHLTTIRLPGAERRIWIRESELAELIEKSSIEKSAAV